MEKSSSAPGPREGLPKAGGLKNAAGKKKSKKKRFLSESFIEHLTIRYGVPRWYVTLLLPSGIALALVAGAFLTGIIKASDSGTSFTMEAKTNAVSAKEKAYEALLAAGAGNTTAAAHPKPPSLQEQILTSIRSVVTFDMVTIAALAISIGPYAADITKRSLLTKKYEKEFTDFLFELSEMVRGGIDPMRSIVLMSERDLGSITKFVRIAAKQTTLGYSFEQAMRNLEKMLGSKLVGNYTDLVVQASYSGGSVSDLIRKASEDMETFITLEQEKLAGLKQYQMILYASQVILIGVAVIMLNQFWPSLQNLSFQGGTGVGFLAKADISDVTVERDMFYLLILNGFLGGLVIGKISEGSIKHGLKHGLIIVLIAYGAFQVMVTSPSADDTKISVVSYDANGYTGLPIKTPVTIKVTDLNGHPKPSALVKFSMDGAGTNTIPTQANAGSDGTVQVKVVLGNVPGPYLLTVKVGKAVTTVPFTAKAFDSGG